MNEKKDSGHVYLPISGKIPVHYLILSLEDTTTSYKYLWLWSILKEVLNNESRVLSVGELICDMAELAAKPIIEFKLNFGIRDNFKNLFDFIILRFFPDRQPGYEDIIGFLKENKHEREFKRKVNEFARYVPYRFLSPWFQSEINGLLDAQRNMAIINLSYRYFNDEYKRPLYTFDDDNSNIVISEPWAEYFRENYKILEAFVLWNLTRYLTRNNPNAPNIQEKLKTERNRNLSNGRKFWKQFLTQKSLLCIYSGRQISENNFSLDHYLPWSYCGHDYLWNLIPTTIEVNASKSNNIPDSGLYLDKFIAVQSEAIRAVAKHSGLKKIMEDYAIFLNLDISSIILMNKNSFITEYRNRIIPHVQIAQNMGFKTNFVFKK